MVELLRNVNTSFQFISQNFVLFRIPRSELNGVQVLIRILILLKIVQFGVAQFDRLINFWLKVGESILVHVDHTSIVFAQIDRRPSSDFGLFFWRRRCRWIEQWIGEHGVGCGKWGNFKFGQFAFEIVENFPGKQDDVPNLVNVGLPDRKFACRIQFSGLRVDERMKWNRIESNFLQIEFYFKRNSTAYCFWWLCLMIFPISYRTFTSWIIFRNVDIKFQYGIRI